MTHDKLLFTIIDVQELPLLIMVIVHSNFFSKKSEQGISCFFFDFGRKSHADC
ncbi:Hypothetical protein Minf_2368 [Methylacidiphilum infernorum V4]|uniref:Uncharacterized protein n=1 Tax=Methylacidiphilum infernorum (isolate V4) TaxID=481448 RepID=B3E0U5_METI4|nr:Hypothetical protein Minf_2368 [Methylacidiphilum infernorum V4]